MLFFKISLILIFILTVTISNLSATEFRFDNWTTAEGLPQNTINTIVQTRDGYLWIGTFGGLVRFDGVRFTIFNTVNAPSLKSQRITALHEDRSGTLWIGTETGEISCLSNGELYSFDDSEEEEIFSLYVDSRTVLWAGGSSGARRYQLPENPCGKSAQSFERIKPPLINNRSSDQISTIIETSEGSIWLNNFGVSNDKTGRLLQWRDGKSLEVFDVSDGLPAPPSDASLHGIYISDIALHSFHGKQTLWVADSTGVFRFNGKKFIQEIVQQGEMNERVKFTYDREGNLVANFIKQIARLKKDDSWELIPADELIDKQSRSFFADREGDLWLGTVSEGLWRLKRNYIESFDETKGVSKNQTAAVMEDSLHNLWIAGFGLHRLINGIFLKEESIPDSYLLSLAEKRDGTLLIGGYDVLFSRQPDGSVTNLTPEIRSVLNDPSFAIKAIYEDLQGNIWLGFRDKGLLRRDKKGHYQRFTTENGLPGNQVQYITETRDGSLWFGLLGGASRYLDGRFQNLTIVDGFGNDNIRAINETADGNIYFGTYGGGLSRLKDGVIRTVTRQNGLFDDVVSRIIIDGNDNVWMLGNLGVFTVRKKELDDFFDGETSQIFCRSFGTADGMITAEGNGGSQPAGWLVGNNQFWFPTIRGYVAITPPAIDTFLPPVMIEEVKINNQIADIHQDLEFKPGDQNIEIRYTGLSFNRSEQLRFRYMLKGLDTQWTEAGTRRTAYFPHLPAGTYLFSVQAASADGIWNEQTATLKITVLPPFYQTWWFFCSNVVLLLSAAYLLYSYQIMRLKRARVMQEGLSRRLIQIQEDERKRLAGDLHDSLSQNLVIIKNRAMLSLAGRKNIENVFAQIEEIAKAASESLVEVREIAASLRPFQIDRLGLTKAFEALVRKFNSPELKVTASIDKIDSLLEPEMEINLYRIVQEGLNNIVKHSGARCASIEVIRDEKSIQVYVRDDGHGFNLDKIPRAEQNSQGGFGLIGIYERARILGTVPHITSETDKGTCLHLRIWIVQNGIKSPHIAEPIS